MMAKKKGTIYVLHFSRPYRHAKHYVGWTDRPIEERLAEHRAGRGARLCAVVCAVGIELLLSHTVPGTRDDERKLKKRGGASRHCRICRASV